LTNTDFSGLGFANSILEAIAAQGFTTPTPIQAQAIPGVLAGRDLLGIAQTGTGKTGAFVWPMLQHLTTGSETGRKPAPKRGTKALIMAPTRELAVQINETIAAMRGRLSFRHTCIFGGVGRNPQVRAVARGTDIVVGTPGRLLDLINTKELRLDSVTHLVLDEADRMLDMGFIRDVKKIIAHAPKARQTLMFSATMPDDVAKLAAGILHNPVRVEVTPEVVTVEKIDQKVFHVEGKAKQGLLTDLLQDPDLSRVIVFTRTKHGANRVAEKLARAGIEAAAIHGNKSQNARQQALGAFRDGKARVLVATDIAARGIDVTGISHVINFELPNVPESYVHRIGRTARAGRGGIALSFCGPDERSYLRDIEKLTGVRLTVAGGAANDSRPAPTEGKAPGGERKHTGDAPKRRRRRSRGGSRRAA
jgi:ATP-dependent RNA helicase RhlE